MKPKPTFVSLDPKDYIEIVKEFNYEWDLTAEQMMMNVELMEKDNVALTIKSDPVRLFLYAKGILSNNDKDRSSCFDAVLKDVEKSHLLKMIVDGSEGKNSVYFGNFVKAHPEWNKGENVFVVHRDHPKLVGKEHALVERSQKGGLSFMHAPIVLQHYLVAMNTDEAVPMVDMVKYLRQKASSDMLYRLVWLNQGGDSFEFLKGILHETPNRIVTDMSDEALTRGLIDFGPALLSGCQVTETFQTNEWQHLGAFKQGENVLGLHAMLLIGYRRVGNGTRYLLQNWWHDKPYVEVDADYLKSMNAYVYFIREKQFKMGNFAQNYEPFISSDFHIEAAETLDVENLDPNLNAVS